MGWLKGCPKVRIIIRDFEGEVEEEEEVVDGAHQT